MTSSMIAGEKKWASARRSGMTVLGKVAVPKPLNLPSQKLENRGLDPNVEIVPKGTIGWGSQPSSVPNAWGSSASPNADGSSPRHLSGRPSSGGGSRPSTAGSDRTQDNNPKVWGPNSRPSSASGDLTSNQTALTSLRPHSAETRPGSSQLSRFAESSFDTSLKHGSHVASNNQVVTPANNDKFSLSSGDFPTLGSEKDSSGRNIESQEHGYDGRPGSSSSKSASGKEKNIDSVGNVQSQTTWAKDGPQHAEHGVLPASERWHGDIPPGANPHRPPHHFDAWHGPPMNHPAGWYRGPPGGPPYGAPLHPGGFPMEPFPFYHPQRPPNESHPGLRGTAPRGHHPQMPPNDSYPGFRGTAPRGHHPKNGELGRPHGPEGFTHPRMLLNPGFYPGPVPYEGFYGPPMSYCNPNERDMPFVGPPSVYKRHPYENAIDPHSRSPVHGSRGKPSTPEQRESRSNHSSNNREPYKVLLKHTNEWDEKRAEEERDHGVPSNIPAIEKKDPRFQKNEWGLDDNHGSFPSGTDVVPESRGKVNTGVDNLGNKLKSESSFRQSSQALSANPENSTLIQRIDDLNAKTRNLDGRPEFTTRPHSGDRFNQPYPSGTTTSRRPSYGAQGRVDHRGKRLNNQDVDGWREKSSVVESSAGVSVTNSGIASNVLICDHHDVPDASGKPDLILQGKDDGDHPTAMLDESDNIAQRAKMREIAKQRAEKLQKEEEERIREQKVKAMAKLDELNRRAHIAVTSHQKSEKAPPSSTAQQEEKSRKFGEPNTDTKSETSSSTVVGNSKDQISASNSIMVGENTVVFDGALLVRPNNVHPKTEVANFGAASKVGNGSASKHKQIEYKQKQSLNSVKGVTENSVTSCQTGIPNKSANDAAHSGNVSVKVGSIGEPSQVASSNVMTESSTHQKKKNNKSSKNKYRADDVVPTVVAPSTVAKETNTAKVPVQKPELDLNLLQPKANVAKHFSHDVEQHPSLLGEGTSGKGSHQWKPQQSRRIPRNQLGNIKMGEREKSHGSDTVAWAPVQSEHIIRPIDKPDIETKPGSDTTNAKESVVQNNIKTKRAEMERYIPKPVAKELALQGSIQQQAVHQNLETTQDGTSTKAIVGPAAESKSGDSKQNKPSRARGAWKQRGSSESAPGLQEVGKNVQKPIEQDQPLDIGSSKEQTSDGWNSNDYSVTSDSVTTAVTNTNGQGVSVRGKRHPFKGHRNMGNNFDLDHGNTNKISSESDPPPDPNQIDKNNGLKENRFGGEHQTSQWQPKTQVYSAHNRRNRPSEGQMEVPANKTDIDQSHPEQVNVVHEDFKREQMPASSFRGRSHSPNLSTSNIAELESGYVKNNQNFSSGFRRNGNYNNRNGRSHESRGDGSFNRERPRQNSHFEYQPIGQYRNNKPSNIEGSTEGYQNMGSRYRERNQGQPRRGGGNFNVRQGAPVHGDSRYD